MDSVEQLFGVTVKRKWIFDVQNMIWYATAKAKISKWKMQDET